MTEQEMKAKILEFAEWLMKNAAPVSDIENLCRQDVYDVVDSLNELVGGE